VCWDPTASNGGCLYAGGEDGQLYRIEMDQGGACPGRYSLVGSTGGGMVLGVTVDGCGRVVMCAPGVGALCLWDPGQPHLRARPFVRSVSGESLIQPNYAAFGADGTLYFSDSGIWGHDNGRLLQLSPDGRLSLFSREPSAFTNGLAVSSDGATLWCVESRQPFLTAFDLRDPSPRAQRVERFEGCVLDGLAPTDDGGLLVSCYRPDRIYHRGAAGKVRIVADDPQGTLLGAPTNVAFAGPRLEYVVAANLGRWHLTLLDLKIAGAPLHRPVRWGFE
jgi:gluconolactonase